MIESLEGLLSNFGFPIFVACILLYDKMKSNGQYGQLILVVKNNNEILREILAFYERRVP